MKLTTFLLLVLFLFSCKKESAIIENPYEGCCESQPVVDSLNSASFFIPNSFSPDNDGVNDQLRFSCREIAKLDRLEDFVILDRNLDTLLFKKEIILDSDYDRLWTYTDSVDTKGLITFKFILIATNGETKKIESTACAIDCEVESDRIKIIETIDFNGCIWGTQWDGFGGYNQSLSSFENC